MSRYPGQRSKVKGLRGFPLRLAGLSASGAECRQMGAYAVTFRIADDSTYADRYASFTEEIRRVGTWWADPTSFYAVKTHETIDEFCDRIYYKSSFNGAKDLYLVLDADEKSGRIRGKIADQDIFRIIPYLKKL